MAALRTASRTIPLRRPLIGGPPGAIGGGADALILSAPEMERLETPSPTLDLWLRIDDLERGTSTALLARATGVVVAARGTADVQHAGAILSVAEASLGLADGALGVIAMIESAEAMLGLADLPKAGPRLRAVGWDAAALARSFGAEGTSCEGGGWIGPLAVARAMTLAAAAAAGVPALDSAAPGLPPDLFEGQALTARRDGFAAKIASDLDQLAAARRVFPS